MARKPRIHRPFAFYHVMLRGNNKQHIFFSDQDRIRFCLRVQEGIECFGHFVHGFCLMSNHVHLIIQTADLPLSSIMHHLSSHYARYINWKEERVGHLFQGRFKAILVDADNYLSELVRYVHLNPVRAGLVSTPEDYRWSGHRSYLGLERLEWLTQDWVLRKFHAHEQPARELYNEFIKKGIGEKIPSELRLGTYNGNIIGDPSFAKDVLSKSYVQKESKFEYSIDELINAVSTVLQISATDLVMPGKQRNYTQARGIVVYIAKNITFISTKELAAFFGRDDTVLNKLAAQIQKSVRVDPHLVTTIQRIKEHLQRIA